MKFYFGFLISIIIVNSLLANQVKNKDSTSFINAYKTLVKKLQYDPYESQADYSLRLKTITKLNLSFVETQTVKMKYDPESQALSIDSGEAYDPLYGVPNTISRDKILNCDSRSIQNIFIDKSSYKVMGCSQIGYENKLFDAKRGLIFTYKKNIEKYSAVNAFGVKVQVTSVEKNNFFLVDSDDFFENLISLRIMVGKDFAKNNSTMKLKLKGKIINPQEIEWGGNFIDATYDSPTKLMNTYIGAFVQIDQVSLISNDGREIQIFHR